MDTNIWLVAGDSRSARHGEITTLLTGQDWASPTPVIAETGWLILDRLGTGPHQRFLRLVTTGQLEPIELSDTDWQRCVELVTTYADLRLDLADAALIAIAERLGKTTIATLNPRDFRVVRPAHVEAFELVPEHSEPCRPRHTRFSGHRLHAVAIARAGVQPSATLRSSPTARAPECQGWGCGQAAGAKSRTRTWALAMRAWAAISSNSVVTLSVT